jgi:acetyl esterase/lipase
MLHLTITLVVFAFIIAFAAPTARAQGLVDEQLIMLWPQRAPGATADALADVPTLQVFLPPQGTASGAAFVVCPGGGYQNLAPHETKPIGQWLARHGITAFVLRYRVAPYKHPAPLDDAQRAMRHVRYHARSWKLDPDRIGILGFSAGGHLAATVCTLFTSGDANAPDPIERVSSRPDLQVLIYPVTVMAGPNASEGLRKRLLGDAPPEELVQRLSADRQVTSQTPPAFLVHSTTDGVVPVEHCDMYAAALNAAGIEYEYIRGDYGKHGFGLQDFWTVPCMRWLAKHGFTDAAAAQR